MPQMNTDEHRFWKQRAAKVAKKGQKQNSLLPLLPSVFFFSFRLVTVGAMVLGSCAVAVAQEQVGGHALATPSIRIWDLAVAGGIFMIPIAGMSLLAVTMAIERLFALRRGRVLP